MSAACAYAQKSLIIFVFHFFSFPHNPCAPKIFPACARGGALQSKGLKNQLVGVGGGLSCSQKLRQLRAWCPGRAARALENVILWRQTSTKGRASGVRVFGGSAAAVLACLKYIISACGLNSCKPFSPVLVLKLITVSRSKSIQLSLCQFRIKSGEVMYLKYLYRLYWFSVSFRS